MDTAQRLYIANLKYGDKVDNIYFIGGVPQAERFNAALGKSKQLADKKMPWEEFRAAFIKMMAEDGFTQTAK